ncbi:MAG: hypothetical protein RSF83_03120 [Hungatella sp.]
MGKIAKRVGILTAIFFLAVGIYFIMAQNTVKKTGTVYTAMEEATIPVVYIDLFDPVSNRLPGYLQEMGQSAARESLTVLPKDRKLEIRIAGYGERVLSVQYEIRSMDLKQLVERTQVTGQTSESAEMTVELPIQNLLTRGTEYLLDLTVQTEQHEAIHYYTRLLWPSENYAEQMAVFAKDFSMKTLDREQAKSLVTYLETNHTEDNSSLGEVTIRSSFSQLTFAGLKMKLEGDMQVCMKELDGIMGQVQVQYQLTRDAEDGSTEAYEVTDYYTLKWNTQRIYLMDFKRTTTQVFSGARELYSAKRILLGVGADDCVDVQRSLNSRHLAYVFNQDLWSYDQSNAKAVKIFSFRSEQDTGGRSTYDQHDVEILSVEDNGNVNFLVYGYMNRGNHEGYMGISLYHYNQLSDAIEERFFVPVDSSYEFLKQDINRLAYLSSSDMLYLMLDHAIYGIDLKSNEYMVVADALKEGSYSISEDKKSIAWQEGQDQYGAKAIHVFNLEDGNKREILGEDGCYLQTLGFLRGDYAYGLAHPDDLWTIHGRAAELPMYALEIVDANLEVETRYEKPGCYLSEVIVEDARIHMKRLVKTAVDGQYSYLDEDTIVCNTAAVQEGKEGIGWYASETRRKLYFVQLDDEIRSSKAVKIAVPGRITYGGSDTLTLKANQQIQDMQFYAYGQGKLWGSSSDFAKAVEMAYDKMGIVVDANQRILWDRVNRASLKNIREPQSAAYPIVRYLDELTESKDYGDGLLILDARGATLNQMLYFIDKGYPVVAYVASDSYVLLCGYDQYNVTLYNPQSDQLSKMGLNDATEYFKGLKNDFVCGVELN